MRFWHQARTELDRLPVYRDAMAAHFKKIGEPGSVVDLHGMMPGTYTSKYSSVDNTFNFFTYLHSLQVLNNVRRAEQEGYDCVLLCNLPDRIQDEAQSLVDIPVVNSAQASMYAAAMLGHRFALFTMNPEFVPIYEILITRYGMDSKSAGVHLLGLEYDEIANAHDDPTAVIEHFSAKTRELAKEGVDVIIPGEAPICALLSAKNFRRVDEIPIVDTLGATLKFGEAMVRLSQVSGVRASKSGFYGARPPQERLEELTKFYRLNEFGG